MRLRPYRISDFPYIREWIGEERAHALWCAGTLPYPLTLEAYEAKALEDEDKWNNSRFTAVNDEGVPVGAFQMGIDDKANSAFMLRVVIAPSARGKGWGREMVCLAMRYAFTIANVDSLRLRAFENNVPAVRCYRHAGLHVVEHIKDAYNFRGEQWNIYVMEARR